MIRHLGSVSYLSDWPKLVLPELGYSETWVFFVSRDIFGKDKHCVTWFSIGYSGLLMAESSEESSMAQALPHWHCQLSMVTTWLLPTSCPQVLKKKTLYRGSRLRESGGIRPKSDLCPLRIDGSLQSATRLLMLLNNKN